MNGVIYLANTLVTDIKYIPGFGLKFYGAILISFIIILLILYGISKINHIKFMNFIAQNIFTFCLLILIFTFVGSIFGYEYNEKEITEYYTWEVIVDNSVSFNDFHNAYEIVNIHGDIYTVKEKEAGSIQKYLTELENNIE